MKIEVNNIKYKIVKDKEKAYVEEDFIHRCTDYFNEFDFIVGDYAYGKLRLKGFNNKNNKNFKPINDYKNLEKYIKENCAFGCKYYILEKEKN